MSSCVEPTLFDLEVPLGSLPVGSRFVYDGWGEGLVVENDGRMHAANIHVGGHQVASVTALNPGGGVVPA